MSLLVLRAEPGATRTVEAASKMRLDPVKLPLFRAEPLAWDSPPPETLAAVAFTSAQAPRLAGPALAYYPGLPAYAVGPATAEAARNAGFARVIIGSSDARALGQMLAGAGSVLHFCGEEHEPLSPLTAIVYRMTPVPVAPEALAQAEDGVALVHSAAVGRRFGELVGEAELRSTVALAAVSARAAAAAGPGWRTVAVADEPREAALLALAARLCQKARPR